MYTFDWAFVEQLRETALCYPHRPENGLAPSECLFQEVMFGGVLYDLMLTYELFDDIGKQAWHLTVGRHDHGTADPQHVMKLVLNILGQGGIQEITHMMPPEFRFQRQFIREEHRKFDPVKREFVS